MSGDKLEKKHYHKNGRLRKEYYESELRKLQIELVKLQEWVKHEGHKVVIIFEGRDAAGKGGVIKRITEGLNPRIARIVALGKPTDKEESQWYFQRYVAELPSEGEIVLFDRSWYNRAGVDRVMDFRTSIKLGEFFRTCPQFEQMLMGSGIKLIKYWFSVSPEEQERRFQARMKEPTKRWKLSPMDMKSRTRWTEYSQAKDEMFEHTDTEEAPWYVVEADDKKKARLNCISHLISQFDYKDVTPAPVELPERQDDESYVRPPRDKQKHVPASY